MPFAIRKWSLVLALSFASFPLCANATDIELWRLDCGAIQLANLAAFSDTFDYAGRKTRLTDSCYLIRHEREFMLWDTGLPTALLNKPIDEAQPMSPTLAVTLPQQLAKINVRPEQIGRIGISHYHFDHLGQAASFPQARLLIGKADWDALKSATPPFAAQPQLAAPWLKGGKPVEPETGDKDVFGDGSVVMLAAPGHTPGSYALLVKLDKTGPVVLSGDVVHFEEQFANRGVPPFNTDRAQSLASMERLQGIAKNLKAILIVQHDSRDISKLPVFPKSAH